MKKSKLPKVKQNAETIISDIMRTSQADMDAKEARRQKRKKDAEAKRRADAEDY